MFWHVGMTLQPALFRFFGRFDFHERSLKICLKIWFMWLVLQEVCVSRSFLCLFKAAIYLNYILRMMQKIYFENDAENIKDLFQIYFYVSRRLLLKIYLWHKYIFVSYDANIFMEGMLMEIYLLKIYFASRWL